MSFRNEFPTYPIDDMPSLPEGWTDESWHNDACPKYSPPLRLPNNGRLEVFIDWLDPVEREWTSPIDHRFIVCLVDDAGIDDVFESNEWDVVLTYVAHKTETRNRNNEGK